MKLLYFAWLRIRIGKSGETLAKPAEVATVADLIDWLIQSGEPYATAFARRDVIRAAVNHEHVKDDYRLADTDEVALFPPVTGG